MGLRDALRQSSLLTFILLGSFAYVLLVLLNVWQAVEWFTLGSGDFVGQSAVGGIAGVVVMLVWLGVIVVLYGEVVESEPAPKSWPPSE